MTWQKQMPIRACVLAALALLGGFEFKQPRLRHSYTRLCFTRSPTHVYVSATAIC